MVLVLGVSAGASGARAVVAHSDKPDLPPIDYCFVPRPAGAGLEGPALTAIEQMHDAALQRGEVISATAVASRSQSCSAAIRSAAPRLRGRPHLQIVVEAAAQLRYLSFLERLPEDGSVVLYDLGSSSLTLTLADCATGAVTRTTRSTTLSGDGFDTLLQWRLAKLGVVIDCETSRKHREALSGDGVVAVADRKSGDRVVFTANDFTELAAAGVQHSVSSINQLVGDSELPVAVVLLGGCGRNRQLAEQLESMLALPVYPELEPELVSARGAVLFAEDRPGRVVKLTRRMPLPKTKDKQAKSKQPPAPATLETPRRRRASRRKLIAAFAVTAALGATIAGLIATDRKPQAPQTGTPSSHMETGRIPAEPFK
ncbi:MAG: hypothetical protein HOQ24_12685 [Mycobacteriaceae bacterium]|nr:hypothetical protein [Mycobacteriaceae bacterium]